MDLKKEKLFVSLVGVLGAICLAGVAFSVVSFVSRSQTQEQIQKTQKSLQKLIKRGKEPALSEKNLGIEKENARRLAWAKKQKIDLLDAGALPPSKSAAATDPAGFRSTLTEDIGKRLGDLSEKKIAVGEDAKYFGFSRYQTKNTDPAADALPLLSSEQAVIRTLADSLVSARGRAENKLRESGFLQGDKRLFLYLKSIRREAGEIPMKDGIPAMALAKDELAVAENGDPKFKGTGLFRLLSFDNARTGVEFPSMRRKNVVDSAAFQVSFVGTTAVLRDFVADFSPNAAGKYKFPIYVRDIAVRPAALSDIETANRILNPEPAVPAEGESAGNNAAFDIFGNAPQDDAAADSVFGETPAAPVAPVKSVVRPETLSEFTVTLEFAQPVKKSPVPAEDNAKE